MSSLGSPEINNPAPGGILVVGRDYGSNEQQQGIPFVGRAGKILNQALAEAGIRRTDINITNVVNRQPYGNDFTKHDEETIAEGIRALDSLVETLQPNLIVSLGNEASYCCVDDWPDRDRGIAGATGIEDRRGYIWEGRHGGKVLTTVHPAFADRTWVPWRALLTLDLKRAKAEANDPLIRRPTRDVVIVTNARGDSEARRHLASAKRAAFDIEIDDEQRLACIGFAPTPGISYVYTPDVLERALALLTNDGRRFSLVGQNGQFDLHFLLSRNGRRVVGYNDDTMLAWHSCYPELAGKSAHKNYKMTRKSLAFLASLMTTDAWWKDYDFETDEERYILNGRDCCITLDIMEQLDPTIDTLGVREIYEHEIGLIWPVVEMQARGILIDEERREGRISALTGRFDELSSALNEVALPLLEQKQTELSESWHLFEQKWTCPCCRNGSSKTRRCTTCAGIVGTGANGSIKKGDVIDWIEAQLNPNDLRHKIGGDPYKGITKDQLIEDWLDSCKVCEGQGQRTWLEVNPNSPDQIKILLYDVLKMKPKFEQKRLSVAEDKLKALLAEAQ